MQLNQKFKLKKKKKRKNTSAKRKSTFINLSACLMLSVSNRVFQTLSIQKFITALVLLISSQLKTALKKKEGLEAAIKGGEEHLSLFED